MSRKDYLAGQVVGAVFVDVVDESTLGLFIRVIGPAPCIATY